MVLQKRLGYGSRGHQVHATPRVPTLAPGIRSTRRKKNEMYALDLLATVAGTLSADQEDSSSRSDINGTAASYTTNRRSVESEQFDAVPAFSSVALRKDCCKECTVGCTGACACLRQNNICLAENSSTQNVADAALHSSFDTMGLDTNPPSVASSDGSSGVHLSGHDRGHSSFCWGEVQHAADRDDDENSSGCVHPSTSGSKGDYLPHFIGECRTRRLSATRFRKAARNKICGEMSNKGSKLNFCGKKISTTRRRVQLQRRMSKTKRVADCYLARPSDEGIVTETGRTSFCMGDQDPPCASDGYHVKLTIKSFNIPELFVEIPENATVGSLKKIVMDAVTTTIEGSLRVGVLLQGAVIQDDSKTLHQAGFRHGAKLDNIGFTLECEAEQDSQPSVIAPKENDSIGASVVEPLSMIKCEEPLPENVDELAAVPLSKSKPSDFGQRRKRRPFSVAEVEALVEAVEQLGTGRWRDVKCHAFGVADHRTYVDLKDKWKNLVRTSSIPPQLRRGKAIPPQELLDRVLAAQAYWSLQQAKPQDSPPAPESCLA